MKSYKRLEKLQEYFGSAHHSIDQKALSETLKGMSPEDIEMALAWYASPADLTREQQDVFSRFASAHSAAMLRCSASPLRVRRQKPRTMLKPFWPGPLSALHLTAEKARRSLRKFVEQAWPVLEPGKTFVPGAHIDGICQALQAISEGRIKDLIINIPPGHAKSLLTAVFWPAWHWIEHPETRWIFASYKADLAIRDSVKCRQLIESSWYQDRWKSRFTLSSDQNEKTRFANTATGYRLATSVGTGTGERADIVVADDPNAVDQAMSEAERRATNEWWSATMSTRLNDLRTGHLVVVQQRVHEDDLTGNLVLKGGYELLALPEEYDPDRRCTISTGWSDPRTQIGELLWPEKNGPAEIERMKRELGRYHYAAQYQQLPSPAGGGIFGRSQWRYWQPKDKSLPAVTVRGPDGECLRIAPIQRPDSFDYMVQSWDTAFKGNDDSDYVVGGVWGQKGADRYLIDQVRARMDFPATLNAIKNLSAAHPKATCKLIEDTANGSAVIAMLRREIGGLIAVRPEGGKLSRARAISHFVEAGNVYLPHPLLAPWVDGFIEECAAFPNGRHDDQVDQMTQALIRMITRKPVVMPVYYPTSLPSENAWMG